MTRLGFLLARLMRNEPGLQRLSIGPDQLLTALAGKSIALIGNARALSASHHGAKIDTADSVIRINRAPMPAAISHGTKTDMLALATSIPTADLARLAPSRVLWMSHKRKRLPYAVATSPGFYLHPLMRWQDLHDRLGAPPTTGLMMIDLLARADIAALDLYGFDFFTSLSLSGRRTATQVPHDFEAERDFVDTLIKRDTRITLHP